MKVMSFTAAATIEAVADVSRGHVSVCVCVCVRCHRNFCPPYLSRQDCAVLGYTRDKKVSTTRLALSSLFSWLSNLGSHSPPPSSLSPTEAAAVAAAAAAGLAVKGELIYIRSRSKEKEREREMVIISPADCHPLAFYTILPCKGTNPPTNPLDINGMGRREGGVAGRLANEKTEKRPNTPI